jgi:type I restriction enzyme R subunit
MPKTFSTELDFEHDFIHVLHCEKGWDGKTLHFPTEDDLIENWRLILSSMNCDQDRLNGCELTGTEMQQVLDQVNRCESPAQANRFINGGSIAITRDNEDDALHLGKEVSLRIYSRTEIANGRSYYQIAEQPIFTQRKNVLPRRRGDVLLLINGMPVIHVELKASGVDVTQAVHQIEKYAHEGVYDAGIFSLVQVFVAMNPSETLYFANPGRDGLDDDGYFNDDYMFHWGDFNNEHINDWKQICEELLSIPMAHKMIGFYTVADNGDGILKVLRSYQYHAVSAIERTVAHCDWGSLHPMGGFIAHTTGSGKTMTSFKSAQLVAANRRIEKPVDKVIFLVDRIELGNQSLMEYRNFADETETINATDNTASLVALLKSDHSRDTLIVTSIQKLSRADSDDNAPLATPEEMARINKKRIVIIVDECHRSTFGDMMGAIRLTFPHALLFGFTGTPIYKENAKKQSTTADVFGNQLHAYTMADGLRDGNVLGFDLVKVETYDDYELRKAVALQQAKASTEAEAIEDPKKAKVFYHYMNDLPMADSVSEKNGKAIRGIEFFVGRAQYDRREHRDAVAEDIKRHWIMLSHAGKFHAILATSSIAEAIEYYRLLKHDLKVTAVFDPNVDNSGGQAFKENGLVEIVEDYVARYGGHFTMNNYDSFKKDVASRLAHKDAYKHIDHSPEKQLDMVIVVDQMLTGFDSKWVNTLYLDKVIEYERVIQAFSRTNRVFGTEKPFGNIRYYRKPHTMEKNIAAAIKMYSGERPFQLFVQKLDKNIEAMNDVFADIKRLFEESGIEHFENNPSDMAARAKFAQLFQTLNQHLEAAKVQGFHWGELQYWFDSEGQLLEKPLHKAYNYPKTVDAHCFALAFNETTYLILAKRYKELFEPGGPNPPEIPFQIDSHLTAIDTGRIDTEYMELKFRKWLKSLSQDNVSAEEITRNLNELHAEFGRLSITDQAYAQTLIQDIQAGEAELHLGWTMRDYLNAYKKGTEEGNVVRLVEATGVDESLLREMLRLHLTQGNLNAHGRFDELRATADIDIARTYFSKVSGSTMRDRIVNRYIDTLLRDFLIRGGFDVDEYSRTLAQSHA